MISLLLTYMCLFFFKVGHQFFFRLLENMGPHNPLIVLQRSLFSRVSVFFSNMGASKKKQRKQKVLEHVHARKQSNYDKISSSKETIPRTTSSRDPRVKETLCSRTLDMISTKNNLGDITVLAGEIFSSSCRPHLKNACA